MQVAAPSVTRDFFSGFPFVEVARLAASPRDSRSLFTPQRLYGTSRFWMVTAGVRLRAGDAHSRMGRYRVALRPSTDATDAIPVSNRRATGRRFRCRVLERGRDHAGRYDESHRTNAGHDDGARSRRLQARAHHRRDLRARHHRVHHHVGQRQRERERLLHLGRVGNSPILVDSVKVDNSTTLGDIAVSDDGGAARRRHRASSRFHRDLQPGRSAQAGAPLALQQQPDDPRRSHGGDRAREREALRLSLHRSNAGAARHRRSEQSGDPQQVFSQIIGNPYVHDTFVRDGLLYLALWNDGVAIWDIGGGGKGGTVTAPVEIGRVKTVNGEVHNVWWLKDPVTGINRYAFIGEEGPSIGVSSVGDIHVVDVSTMSAPREVAFYTVAGAGTHNFSVDEPNGILYAAYYNGGVRALDVRGDLGTCTEAQKSTPAGSSVPVCDLRLMGRELGIGLLDRGNPVYVWGVQYLGGAVYASDMINGIWKLRSVARP